MIRLSIVGDLSLQDPARLEKVMAAAYPSADIVCQVGDMCPGYSIVKKYAAMGKPLYAVAGNHDTEWDTQLGWPRQWSHDTPECHLIGLDNHADSFNDKDWATVANVPNDGKPLLLFVHKPLSTIILPDGSESSHIMGEGAVNADAVKLQSILAARGNVICIHGHWHGNTIFTTKYALCLVEGRGGAAPNLGFSTVFIRDDGIAFHSVEVI